MLATSKQRIVELLKRDGPLIAHNLAVRLGVTDVAIRQHLLALEAQGLVSQQPLKPSGRGRPAVVWSLTEASQSLFPDRHAELTVALLEATKRAVGEDGLDRIIDERARQQIEEYVSRLPGSEATISGRVEALAKLRTAEGYMAETKTDDDGSVLLIEHHCPICDAAKCCLGLCRAELEVFSAALGPDVVVEREEHLLTGATRCVYRIRPAVGPRDFGR